MQFLSAILGEYCMIRTLIFFILVAGVGWTQAQTWTTRNFGVEDGLPHSRVVILNEDKHGYIWVGTYGGGVARFDGSRFESFDESDGLLSSVTLGIQVDSHDDVWVCTPLGISKYSKGSFTNLKGRFERGFFGYDVFEYRDTVFTLLNSGRDLRFGVIFQDSIVGDNHTFAMNHKITNVFAPDQEHLYLALETGQVVLKTAAAKRIISEGMDVIEFFDSKFGVHVLTTKGIFDLTDHGAKLRLAIPGLQRVNVNYDFTMAWARIDGKLAKLQFTDTSYLLTFPNLPFEPAYAMFDSEGNSWFGTIGNGLYVLSEANFVRIGISSDAAYAFVRDKNGNLWTGFKNGLQVTNPDNKILKRLLVGDKLQNRVNALALDLNGNVLVGTSNGLAIVNPATYQVSWTTLNNGLQHQAIRAIEVDHLGRIWIAYQNDLGIVRIDGMNITEINSALGLRSPSVWDMKFSPKNNIMYVCTSLGIQQYRNGQFDTIEIPEFKDKILVALGLYGKHHLLVGSGGAGLAIVDVRDQSYKILTKENGLSSNFIYLVDSNQPEMIWVGTVSGIDQILLGPDFTITNLIHHDSRSGLSPNGANTNAIYLQDGAQFFGMTGGAFQFAELALTRSVDFPLHFVGIEVNGISKSENSDTIFSNSQNTFSFKFNKVNKSGVTSRYQYRLRPWDRDWINTTSDNRAIYSNLPPNEYSFNVRTSGPDGKWTKPLTYHFVIKPPFYLRLEVQLLALLGILTMVGAIVYWQFRLRLSRILLTEQARSAEGIRLRKEIGSDFHDEIGNKLARIINYVGLLKLNRDNRTELLNKTEETTKYLLSGTKDFLWSIDPVNDNVDSLQVHIRDFAAQVLTEKEIEFRMFTNVDQTINLPFGFTRQVNLIFKEAITNVFKHAKATAVDLSVHHEGHVVVIQLKDNGAGFSQSLQRPQGQGLENMYARAKLIGGTLELTQIIPTGTQVKLTFSTTPTQNL